MTPCFAIIEPNTLCRNSLKEILDTLYSQVEILTYCSVDEFIRDSNRHFIHFFVNEEILFSSIDEFESLKTQTTILSTGPDKYFNDAGFNVLDITGTDGEIRKRLLNLHFNVAPVEQNTGRKIKAPKNRLSEREKEVLKLMVQGLINKEIAQKLDISLPTVIFHRNNICMKLGTRSIGRLTVFAVLSGIVDINDI